LSEKSKNIRRKKKGGETKTQKKRIKHKQETYHPDETIMEITLGDFKYYSRKNQEERGKSEHSQGPEHEWGI
jgi:hypothetical protein